MNLPQNFVVVDCETTGLSAERHALLSIGAVTVGGATFYRECLFDERKEIDPEAMKVNGLSIGLVNAQDVFPEHAVEELCRWLREQAVRLGLPAETRWLMGGKNPMFDWGFLEAVTAGYPVIRDELRARMSRRCVDLHALAYWWAMEEGMNLAAPDFETQRIYAQLGFEREPWPHHALNGARLEMYIFRNLASRWGASRAALAPMGA